MSGIAFSSVTPQIFSQKCGQSFKVPVGIHKLFNKTCFSFVGLNVTLSYKFYIFLSTVILFSSYHPCSPHQSFSQSHRPLIPVLCWCPLKQSPPAMKQHQIHRNPDLSKHLSIPKFFAVSQIPRASQDPLHHVSHTNPSHRYW